MVHAINLNLLSMKASAHVQSIKLRNSERGNLTGLTTTQITAEAY